MGSFARRQRAAPVQADVVDRTPATTAWIGSRWWARNPGHVIVVTNEHVEDIFSLSRELAADAHEAAQRIAFATKRAYACEGISTRPHNEPAGYQEICHHLHVFPRYEGDDLYRSPWRDTTSDERWPRAETLSAALAAGA
jgi:histidine triad (HIT) family protein